MKLPHEVRDPEGELVQPGLRSAQIGAIHALGALSLSEVNDNLLMWGHYFRRVYDRGDERSFHLGLVVMDEAFSKLSGDGVEDCLELARNFNLQLVMAFPIDRLGVMAPFAQTIVVCKKEQQIDAQGYVAKVDNYPILLSPDAVEQAIA